MSVTNNKWLYMPVEIKVRELPAKVLLATSAARDGYNVVLGRKAELSKYMSSFPEGIFLGFGAQKNFESEYFRLKNRGFSVSIMDEEGLVTFSDEIYKRLRLSVDTLNNVDLVLAWGAKQASLIRDREIQNKPSVFETGNLRFDVLRPEFRYLLDDEADSIRARFGKTILINSSFGACNHFDGKERYFQALKDKKILQNEDDTIFYKRYFKLKEDVFNAYIEVIPEIAREFPDHTIIVRPHPSENYDVWSEAAGGHENVKVVHEGSVHSWLRACDAVVHHFCTTALEAFALDVPAIAYRPMKDDEIETSLVYKGSIPAETSEILIKNLKAIAGGDSAVLNNIRAEQRVVLNEYIENLSGPPAYENILKAFEQNAVQTSKQINMSKIRLRKLKSQLGHVYRFFKRGMRPDEKNYMDHKFSVFSEAELRKMINDVSLIIPGVEDVQIKRLDPFCYVITDQR